MLCRRAALCLRLEDGEVLWNAEDVNVGALSAAGKHLLIISDDGLRVVLPGLREPRRDSARCSTNSVGRFQCCAMAAFMFVVLVAGWFVLMCG